MDKNCGQRATRRSLKHLYQQTKKDHPKDIIASICLHIIQLAGVANLFRSTHRALHCFIIVYRRTDGRTRCGGVWVSGFGTTFVDGVINDRRWYKWHSSREKTKVAQIRRVWVGFGRQTLLLVRRGDYCDDDWGLYVLPPGYIISRPWPIFS